MKNGVAKFLSQFEFNKVVNFAGDRDAFKSVLNQLEDITILPDDAGNYRFESTMTIGKNYYSKMIYVDVVVKENTDGGIEIAFTAPMRLELIVILISFFIIVPIAFFQIRLMEALGIALLLILCYWWFGTIYRIQQQDLIADLLKRLYIYEQHFL